MKKTLFRDLKLSATSFLAGCGAFFAGSTTLWASEGEQEGGLEPLAWQTDLAIWTAIVFILLIAVLWKFAFGPIIEALDKREKDELDKREKTEKAYVDAKAALDLYNQKLVESDEEARHIREQAKIEAEKQTEKILENARDAIAKEQKRASEEIRAAENNALNQLATKSAELATTLAGKILQQKLDPAEHSKLVERVASDMTAR